MRCFGFNVQQYGDLVINTVAARVLKQIHPESNLTLGFAGDFGQIAPAFIGHPDIDNLHILHRPRDGFDHVDETMLRDGRYDKVFNPMPPHPEGGHAWQTRRHQTQEVCLMHGLPVPAAPVQCHLNRRFDTPKHDNCVALAPFPASYGGLSHPKSIPISVNESIVTYLNARGYQVIQVGSPDEPLIAGDVIQPKTPFFESIRHVLGCRALIGGDSAFAWIASAYSHPFLGLYSHVRGDFDSITIANIQPVNPNGVYLDAATVTEIPLERIYSSIDNIL